MLKMKPDDIRNIEKFVKEHPTGRLLSEMKNWNFQVGDVIVRNINGLDGSISIDNVSDTCDVPKKYKVMAIDSVGVPWVKQLSVRGGLGEKIYCLATIDSVRYSYHVDPEQLEASLLGYQYDPRIEYKRMRASNPNYGGSKNATNED